MIFITTESVVRKGFARFVETRKTAGGIDRIVVDEGHMVSDGSERWRPKVLELIKTTNRGEEVSKLSGKTTRGNVEYQVMEYDKKDETEEIGELARKKLEEDKTGKLVIYCENIEKCQVITDEVADEVERQIYNAQIGNEELKKKS